MARFNPQAFLAGMQSLLTPQQQANQQVQQMRMQQMDKARENEALINQRQLQAEQLGVQRAEAARAGERFQLEKEAAKRQEEADTRAKKIADLGIDKDRTEAANSILKPIEEAKAKLDAAESKYRVAVSRPNAYNRKDYLAITTELSDARANYKTIYDSQKSKLKFYSPAYKFDESIFPVVQPEAPILNYNDAVKAIKTGGVVPVKTGAIAEPATSGVPDITEPQTLRLSGARDNSGMAPVDIPYPEQNLRFEKVNGRIPLDPLPMSGNDISPIGPSPVTPLGVPRSTAIQPKSLDALSLLAPVNLGVGVASPKVGAVKPPVKGQAKPQAIGKDGKPIKQPYVPPQLAPRRIRQRVFTESPDAVLAADEESQAQTIVSEYEKYALSTFNEDPLDPNFNEKYYRHVADPERFKRFTSRYGRALAINYPEAANDILAAAESTMLGALGDKADVPTAIRAALTDTATKTAALVEARDEAKYKKELRPLTIAEMRAKIAYYQSGGARGAGKTVDPFKGIHGRTSAANMYGRSELIELDKIIAENSAALKKTKSDYPEKWKEWANNPATDTYTQQMIVNEARQVKAKILTQQSALRQLIPDAAKFYSAFISFDPVGAVKNDAIASRLRANVGPQAGDYIPYNNESPTETPINGVDDISIQ